MSSSERPSLDLDASGNPVLAGATSAEISVTRAFDTSFNGERDGFISKLDATGAASCGAPSSAAMARMHRADPDRTAARCWPASRSSLSDDGRQPGLAGAGAGLEPPQRFRRGSAVEQLLSGDVTSPLRWRPKKTTRSSWRANWTQRILPHDAGAYDETSTAGTTPSSAISLPSSAVQIDPPRLGFGHQWRPNFPVVDDDPLPAAASSADLP
jgi:hypothetical protein